MLTNDLFWTWIYSIVHSLYFSSLLSFYYLLKFGSLYFPFQFRASSLNSLLASFFEPNQLHNSFFVYFLDIHVAFISFMPKSISIAKPTISTLCGPCSDFFAVYCTSTYQPTTTLVSFSNAILAFFFLSLASRGWELVPLMLWEIYLYKKVYDLFLFVCSVFNWRSWNRIFSLHHLEEGSLKSASKAPEPSRWIVIGFT